MVYRRRGDEEMKINKEIYKFILIILMIVCSLCICNVVEANMGSDFAETQIDGAEGGGGGGASAGTGQTGGLPDLGLFEPSVSPGGATSIIGKILSILRIIGAIMVVVSIAVIGFNSILASASEKAEYQQKLVGVLFAGIFMVASTSIAKWLMSVAGTF